MPRPVTMKSVFNYVSSVIFLFAINRSKIKHGKNTRTGVDSFVKAVKVNILSFAEKALLMNIKYKEIKPINKPIGTPNVEMLAPKKVRSYNPS
jgi:hypothetical protein